MTESDFLDAWLPAPGAALPRFLRFFAALEALGAGEAGWAEESLGAFNRRLARLHGHLVARPVEATVRCGCGEDLEVELPLTAVAEAPDPQPSVEIDESTGRRTFRLPRLGEVGLSREPGALAQACALDGGGVPSAAGLAALDAAWTEADPAAEITLHLACPSCGAAIDAQADLPLFVARDLDLRLQGLMAEIHGLACAYGWTEAEVMAVPPGRRRAYAALITGQP